MKMNRPDIERMKEYLKAHLNPLKLPFDKIELLILLAAAHEGMRELIDYIEGLEKVVEHVRKAVVMQQVANIEADSRNQNAFDLLDDRNDELEKAMQAIIELEEEK